VQFKGQYYCTKFDAWEAILRIFSQPVGRPSRRVFADVLMLLETFLPAWSASPRGFLVPCIAPGLNLSIPKWHASNPGKSSCRRKLANNVFA
jgi:hypothetical protein